MEPDSSRQENSEKGRSIRDRSDEWLLRQWKSGHERAAAVFFDRYAMRLVALIAGRLNHRYRSAIDPDEVVQSALGSFFNAVRHSRIDVSRSVSLWRLLATFARRKMARHIERHSAVKRGGNQTQVPLGEIEPVATAEDETQEDHATELIRLLKSELPDDLLVVVEGMLAGQTQSELAASLKVNERTVRRRLVRIREHLAGDESADVGRVEPAPTSTLSLNLTTVGYNEFVLDQLIGAGGFGKVYRATVRSDGRVVAVKFLRKAFWQNDEARRSFVREIDAASRVHHPGVIRYLGYGESPHGGPYLLSEWIDGETLFDVPRPEPQRFTHWLKQVCRAIEAVYDAGLVHGDLTPRNILVDRRDRITITDFGFSQATAAGARPIIGGTLGFAAPEQIDPCFGTVGPWTDIYAIGRLVHWLVIGTPPNTGYGLGDIIAHTVRHEEGRRPRFNEVEEPFRSILEATLCPSPADRIRSVREVAALLR